jgi:hypothetical protein
LRKNANGITRIVKARLVGQGFNPDAVCATKNVGLKPLRYAFRLIPMETGFFRKLLSRAKKQKYEGGFSPKGMLSCKLVYNSSLFATRLKPLC